MDQLALRVREVVEAIEGYRRAASEVLGVGVTDVNVLVTLWFHGSQTPNSLRQSLGLSSASVTALVDRLEAVNLAVRVRHPTDRRSVIVQLSERGMSSMTSIINMVGQHIAAAVRTETPGLTSEVERILAQIAEEVRIGAEDRATIAEEFRVSFAGSYPRSSDDHPTTATPDDQDRRAAEAYS